MNIIDCIHVESSNNMLTVMSAMSLPTDYSGRDTYQYTMVRNELLQDVPC